jgi:hypothetical protein
MCFKTLAKFFTGTIERPSPSDIVPKSNIVYNSANGKLEVTLTGTDIPFTQPPKVWVPTIPDTNSMDPVLDAEHNNILIAGADEDNQKILVDFLKVGDIAVYQVPEMRAIHRIIKIETDAVGRKFTFKGDNNPQADPFVVRDENIEWLSIGTIY